jgi:hypothetical protein
MSANVYKKRDPNDHTTYIDRDKLIELKIIQKKMAMNRAIQADTERNLSMYRGQPFKHDNYAVLSDGQIIDISPYCQPLYLSYDGNNPALVQGAAMSISPKAIFGKEMDYDYRHYVNTGVRDSENSRWKYTRDRQGHLNEKMFDQETAFMDS